MTRISNDDLLKLSHKYGNIKQGDLWIVSADFGLSFWLNDKFNEIPERLPKSEILGILSVSEPKGIWSVIHVSALCSRGIVNLYENHIFENCVLTHRLGWVPPRMPSPLLQELYWPDAWKVIVICIMLNCTQRTQVERMIETFFHQYPNAGAYIAAYECESDKTRLIDLLRPLGFCNRRSKQLYKFSCDYIDKGLNNVKELYGVGEYAAKCYEMLFLGLFGNEPKDHALKDYYNWVKRTQGQSW